MIFVVLYEKELNHKPMNATNILILRDYHSYKNNIDLMSSILFYPITDKFGLKGLF